MNLPSTQSENTNYKTEKHRKTNTNLTKGILSGV